MLVDPTEKTYLDHDSYVLYGLDIYSFPHKRAPPELILHQVSYNKHSRGQIPT